MTQTDKEREALKPCPFCGAEARRTPIHEIACSNFECKLHCVYFRFENAWNARTQPQSSEVVEQRNVYQKAFNRIDDLMEYRGLTKEQFKEIAAELCRTLSAVQQPAEQEASSGFILVDQEFLDNWYANAVANRPDNNIYKEGLIAAYEDLSARVGTPRESRIDSTAVKIRMRNIPTPPALTEEEAVEVMANAMCNDTLPYNDHGDKTLLQKYSLIAYRALTTAMAKKAGV